MKFLARCKEEWRKFKEERLDVVDWVDVAIRSIKTFVQTSVSYGFMMLAGINFYEELTSTVLLGFLLSAGAAGVSAVWNSIIGPIFTRPKDHGNG